MKDIFTSQDYGIGTIILPIPFPAWIQEITTNDLFLIWKQVAEFIASNAPVETNDLGLSTPQFRVHIEPPIGISDPEKTITSIEFFQLAPGFYPNQDFALAWSESAVYSGEQKLHTKFPSTQKIRYLYVMRHNVGRDRWLNPEHNLKENLPVAMSRAKTIVLRLHAALEKKFPAPPQAPSPIVM